MNAVKHALRRIFIGGDHVNDLLRSRGGVVRCDRCGTSESVVSALDAAGFRGSINVFCPVDGCSGMRRHDS